MTYQDDPFFADGVTAEELVAQLIAEERRMPQPPRSSGISLVVIDS